MKDRPSERWAHTRLFGEQFNRKLQGHIVSVLEKEGHFAVAPEMEELRTRAHMPDNVVFRTKHELALEMIEAARAQGVPHSWVNMDADYGKVPKFLDTLDGLGERYAAQVPSSTRVWTEKPKTCIPHRKSGKGRPPTRPRLVKGAPKSASVKVVANGLRRKALRGHG